MAASFAEPVEHEAKASVVLLPPADPTSNPYLGLAGYQGFADVFARSMMDTTSVNALRGAGVSDDFTVERDLTTNAPIVRVTVTGVDADQAIRQMKIIVAAMPGNLASIQENANVRAASMFTSKVITQDVEATSIRKAQLRAMIAAAGLGVLLTLWGTVWADSVLSRRSARVRSRHAAARASTANDAASPEQSATESEAPADAGADSDSALDDDPGAETAEPGSAADPQPSTAAHADGLAGPPGDGMPPPRETRRPNGGPAAVRASEFAHGRRETRVSRRRSSQGGRA